MKYEARDKTQVLRGGSCSHAPCSMSQQADERGVSPNARTCATLVTGCQSVKRVNEQGVSLCQRLEELGLCRLAHEIAESTPGEPEKKATTRRVAASTEPPDAISIISWCGMLLMYCRKRHGELDKPIIIHTSQAAGQSLVHLQDQRKRLEPNHQTLSHWIQ